MAFTVPALPYAFNALEPHIDAQTMEIHHDKHHAAYVNNANAAIEKYPELGSKSVEDLLWGIDTVPQDIRTAIRNNAGGHSNHSIFWSIMGPGGGGNPPGRLGDTIKSTFGSYDAFKEQLQKAAVGQFGSGWAWLLADKQGKYPVFVAGSVVSIVLVLIYTHLPPVSLWVIIVVNVVLFAGIFSRMIPFQAMSTSVPEMTKRGSFNALGAAIQQVSGGIASVIAGHIVTMAPDGKLEHFPVVGYVVVCATLTAMFTTWKVKQGIERRAVTAQPAAA